MKDVAVIGLSCRFPGADSYEAFWNNLTVGKNSVTEVPPARWKWQDFYGEPSQGANKTNSKWGGFLDHADRFDAAFFGISPREAEQMDPQQRLALELAWQCIDNAGYPHEQLSGKDIGVFVGVSTFDYKELQEKHAASIEGHSATGIHNTIVPNRISYFFNFFGPSIAIDSACAGSLVSIHQAVNAIRAGECESALAGGVSILATPTTFIRFSKVGMLSPTGSCKAFDESADGYVRGEGGGFIFLKPLEKAIADKDHIWGVIKGSAVNHGGRARSITAPSALSQSKVISAALKNAQVSPSTIGFVEAHGTGTPLGDPIEILGLTRAYNGASKKEGIVLDEGNCAISAVKTNIGHLEAAAGIAGCIKTLLALKHHAIPGNSNFTTLNSRIKLEGTPFYIVDQLKPWHRRRDAMGQEIPLRAGVSSFGFGGVNCHIILEESPQQCVDTAATTISSPTPQLFGFSAHSRDELQHLKHHYAHLVQHNPKVFNDLAATLNASQTQLPYREGIIASNASELVKQLNLDSSSQKQALQQPIKLGFMFTGQGSQYLGMGMELFHSLPLFKRHFLNCEAAFADYLSLPISSLINSNNADQLHSTEFSQPALFTVEYALAKTLMDLGLVPDVMIGHSIGEIVAATLANVMSLTDAARLVANRGKLMGSVTEAGGMTAVFASRERVDALLTGAGIQLDIAALNAPENTVVSGLISELTKFKALLAEHQIDSRDLQVSHAFHSALMAPIQTTFLNTISAMAFQAPSIPVVSNVTGELISEHECDANYWVNHIRKPVNFLGGIQTATRNGITAWIEIGATPVLSSLIKRFENLPEVNCFATLKPGTSDLHNLLQLIANFFAAGAPVNLSCLSADIEIAKPLLPTRQFVGQSYWITPKSESAEFGKVRSLLSSTTTAETLVGNQLHIAGKNKNDVYYFSEYAQTDLVLLSDHRVLDQPIMPGAAFISMALAAASELCKKHNAQSPHPKTPHLSDIVFLRPLHIEGTVGLQTQIKPTERADEYSFEIWSSVQRDETEEQSGWEQHAKGVIRLEAVNTAPVKIPFDDQVSALAPVNSQAFYETIATFGFSYGAAFQGVTKNVVQNHQSFADIHVPHGVENSFGFETIRALDAIFQTALALLPKTMDANTIPLPFEIRELNLSAGIPTHCRVMAEMDGGRSSKNTFVFNLSLMDESQTLVGSLKGLTLKLTPKAVITQKANQSIPDIDFCFTPHLIEVSDITRRTRNNEISSTPIDKEHKQQSLIFCHAESLSLAQAIRDADEGSSSVLITADARLMNDESIDMYVDNYRTSELKSILSSSAPINCIYFLGGFFQDKAILESIQDGASIQQAKLFGVTHFIQLCKSLIDLHTVDDANVIVKVVTNKLMNVPGDQLVNPWGAPVVGAAKVFAKEYPSVSVVTLDIDASNTGDLLDDATFITEVVGVPDRAMEYARRDRRTYARQFTGLHLDENSHISLKQQGVYLILGGAGGIGFSLSQMLAKKYQANVVWLGRSELTAETLEKIQHIEALGGKVLYIKADATRADDVRFAIAHSEHLFGPINGVFHSALVLDDSAIHGLTEEKLHRVLASKYEASIELFNALRHKPLDFFAFFSSANSIVANKGQANYVAASAFKDAFALSLAKAQSIPIKVINWGYCGDVGVVASEEYKARLSAQGIESITEAECTTIIERCLSSSFLQIVPFKASAQVLSDIGFDQTQKEVVAELTSFMDADWESHYETEKMQFSDDLAQLGESHKALDTLTAQLVLKTYDSLLAGKKLWVEDNLIRALSKDANHEKFVVASFEILEHVGALKRHGETLTIDFTSVADLTWQDLQHHVETLSARYPWLAPELAITWQCGQHLQKILLAEMPSTEIIFPNMSMHLVEGVYKQASLSQYFNRQTAEVVGAAVKSMTQQPESGKVISILEVGAGTGSTTQAVLEKIKSLMSSEPDFRVEYIYTDISNAFLQYGSLHYEQDYPFVRFALLDVGAHPAKQQFTKNSIDIVIASNVLHATPQLKETLAHIKWLMKKDAALVLSELTQKKNYLTLTFGLLSGWWLSSDLTRRIPNSPLLSPSAWQRLLTEMGFASFTAYEVDSAIEAYRFQSVMSARSDGHTFEQQTTVQVQASDALINPVSEHPFVSADDITHIAPGTSKPDIQSQLTLYLRWQLVDVLKISIHALFETRLNFNDMLLSELGLDSLTAMDLRNRFKKQLKIDVPVELLLGGGNVAAIVDHLYNQLLLQRLMSDNSSANGKATAEGATESDETIEEFLI